MWGHGERRGSWQSRDAMGAKGSRCCNATYVEQDAVVAVCDKLWIVHLARQEQTGSWCGARACPRGSVSRVIKRRRHQRHRTDDTCHKAAICLVHNALLIIGHATNPERVSGPWWRSDGWARRSDGCAQRTARMRRSRKENAQAMVEASKSIS